MLAASLLAATAFAGDALALDATSAGGYNGALGIRPMPTLGLPLPFGNLGFIDAMTPVGPVAFGGQQACGYIHKWRSPLAVPGGPAQLCVLAEIQGGLNQGCPAAAAANIGTLVVSVPGQCGGYNAAGTAFAFPGGADGVQLILNEAPTGLGTGALTGIVVFPGNVSLAVGPW